MIKFNQDSSLEVRYDWSREEILEILNLPLIDLMWHAQIVHRKFNNYRVQLSTLLSVKTCLLYTSDAADEEDSVDLGGRRIIKNFFVL